MPIRTLSRFIGFLCGAALVFGSATWAQQSALRPVKSAPRTVVYDAAQEKTLEGTVASFTAQPTAAPFGPRLVLQTAGGAVDVHLGNGSYLQQNHFTLANGDAVRVVGVNATLRAGGTIFLARVIQKGGLSLTLRTPNGIPLATAGVRAMSMQKIQAQQQGGAR